MSQEFRVVFNDKNLEIIKKISAVTKKKKLSSLLCEALNTYRWIINYQKAGYKIFAIKKDNETEEKRQLENIIPE